MKLGIKLNPIVNMERVRYEAVERKGIGHPDTLCDAIAELASRKYSEAVYEMTGRLPHHYFDKVMLMGGAVDMGLGHGELNYQIGGLGSALKEIGIPVDVYGVKDRVFYEGGDQDYLRTLHGIDAQSVYDAMKKEANA